MISSSTSTAVATLQATLKAATARAADGDYKTAGVGHMIKDGDGDYKPTPKAYVGAGSTIASQTLSAVSTLTKGG